LPEDTKKKHGRDVPTGLAIWGIRLATACYLTALTVLLLARDPVAWLFGIVPDFSPPSRGVHFTTFFVLAVLFAASRLPWKAWRIGVALVLYALTTETLQGLIESRTVELVDYCENLAGLAVGGAVWGVGSWMVRGRKKSEVAED